MIEGHDFVDAYFTNNERTIVETLWYSQKENAYRTLIIKAEEGNQQWEELLKVENVSLDNLHERTYKRIHEQYDMFKGTIIPIAKEEGLIFDIKNQAKSGMLYDALSEFLFDFTPDKEKDVKERLFAFKLKLFELDFIREHNDRKMKADLRKSTTIQEAVKISCELYLSK